MIFSFRQCPFCKGRGTEVDYVGLEMRPVEIECCHCKGNGTIKASPIRQGELAREAEMRDGWKANESTIRDIFRNKA